MSWRRWKLGVCVALLVGVFTACGAAAALDVVINAKFFLFFVGLIGKDVVLFLKEHPAEEISFDTENSNKKEP